VVQSLKQSLLIFCPTELKIHLLPLLSFHLQSAFCFFCEQIKNDKAFIRTRENMSEFGGCAAAAKSVRVALSQILRQFSDPRLTGRLTAIMKQINLEDQSEARGRRAVEISTVPQYLNGLDFDINASLTGVFNAPYTLTNTVPRNSATFTVPAFNPANLVSAPAGATHFRLLNAIACIFDWVFNANTGSYEPTVNGRISLVFC